METKTNLSLTEEEIIEKLRQRDSQVTRDYFYGYCRVAYHVYDKRYSLRAKPGMDFYSVAHEYYLTLNKHDFKQLENRKPGVSLKTWMINGFRFVLLDRLKIYNKEHRAQDFMERLNQASVRFDVPDDNFKRDFHYTVEELCDKNFGSRSRSAILLRMMLIEGHKGKEAATRLGISPSAVTQRFHKLMEDVVVPYFKQYYTRPEALAPQALGSICGSTCKMIENAEFSMQEDLLEKRSTFITYKDTMKTNRRNRVTPAHISALKPNEIFVFGSNLAGMHGGGAARAAHLHFGALMGVGVGPQGQSYAIPTMQGGVETIRPYVDEFILYARQHPELTFLVTPIGCGIAGFSPEEIAPLFQEAIEIGNIHLPECFWEQFT